MKIIKALLVSTLLVVMADLHSAQPLPNGESATSGTQVPFSGTVFYDLSDEWLPLTGSMHVQAQTTPKGVLSVRVNLDGVTGTGETTGIRFNAIGGARATIPSNESVTADFDFRIIPADGFTLSCTLRVRLTLTFGVSGALTDVKVEQMSVVH